jgi:hypothetical protein
MAPTLPSISPARLRSYIFRLPLFTRISLLAITVFWILGLQSAWNVRAWGALVPREVGLASSECFHGVLGGVFTALAICWFESGREEKGRERDVTGKNIDKRGDGRCGFSWAGWLGVESGVANASVLLQCIASTHTRSCI